MGKPAIVFTGDHNGRMNVIAVVSDKRLDLFVQTIYVNTKKGNLATPTGEQAPINTPEANGGTVSKDIVAEERPGVNNKSSLSKQGQADDIAPTAPWEIQGEDVAYKDVAENATSAENIARFPKQQKQSLPRRGSHR